MRTGHSCSVWFGILITLMAVNVRGAEPTEYRRLSVSEYRDKMKAGWIGQIAGVSWARPPSSSTAVVPFPRIECRSGCPA